jgi:hypothetical protein
VCRFDDDGVAFKEEEGMGGLDPDNDPNKGPSSQPTLEFVKAKNLSAWNSAERVSPLSRNDRMSAAYSSCSTLLCDMCVSAGEESSWIVVVSVQCIEEDDVVDVVV